MSNTNEAQPKTRLAHRPVKSTRDSSGAQSCELFEYCGNRLGEPDDGVEPQQTCRP